MAAENSKGFEIAFDPARHILRMSAWGFCDAEFMKKYDRAFTEKAEELFASGKEWYVLMDLTEFYPRSEEVRNALCQQIANAKKWGMKKLAYLGEKSVVQLQLNKLFLMKDMQDYAFVESEEEAFQWLLSERPDEQRKEGDNHGLK